MDELPEELLLIIFTYLNVPSINNMRKVSKKMLRIAEDRALVYKYIRANPQGLFPFFQIGTGMLEHYLKAESNTVYGLITNLTYQQKQIQHHLKNRTNLKADYVKCNLHYNTNVTDDYGYIFYTPSSYKCTNKYGIFEKNDLIQYAHYERILPYYQNNKTIFYNLVKLLLKYGADPNENEGTALKTSISFDNNKSIVSLLLDSGANPNRISNLFDNMLCETQKVGYPSVYYLPILLEAGLDPNKRNERMTALGRILEGRGVYAGDIQTREYILNLLIKHGANPNVYSIPGQYISNKPGYPINILIRNASKWDNPLKILKQLLKLGANPHNPEFVININNSLHMICIYGPTEWKNPLNVIKILIKDHNLKLKPIVQRNVTRFEDTILAKSTVNNSHLYREQIDKNICNMVKLFFQVGMNPWKYRTILGEYPLHWAVKYRRYELVLLLLHHNADPNSLDDHQEVPLHKFNVDRFIDVDDYHSMQNRNNAKKIMNALLKAGANPEIKNNQGKTGRNIIYDYIKKERIYRLLL